MRRFSRWKVLSLLVTAAAGTSAYGQTVVNGNTMALKSSGAASGSAWTLSSDGYLGTYVQVPSTGATVSFDINAIGTSSNGVLPNLTLSVAGTNDPFTVTTGANGDYIASVTLPGDSNTSANGTYAVRVQLDNQTGTATPSVKINSLSVSGATVVNSNTDTIALNAAQTYSDKFRSGPGTITLKNSNGIHLGAGTSVQVKLTSNAFNFAGAVYGQSPFFQTAQWLNYNTSGQSLTPTTSEQINYQNAIKQNFNMIVPQNAGKWINDEFTQNSPQLYMLDAMNQFASQNNLRVRQHNLIWNTEQPSYIDSMFTSNTFTNLNSDITSRINYYVSQKNANSLNIPRGRNYTEMDVFNEPFHGQSAQDNYLKAGALGVSGVGNVYAQVAAADAAAGANTRLMTNEYNVLQFSPASISSTGASSGSDNYANWYLNGVQSFKNAGAPIGGIGMELYVNAGNAVSAATMQQALGNMSVAKDPSGNPMSLSLTEFGVANGQTPTVAKFDTDLQTALAMMYGNPQATTFGYWAGIGGPNDQGTEGTHIYQLYDTNYNLTTTGAVWQAFQSQYNTNLTLTTDANGNINFNGTYGTYQVTVAGQNYTLNLVPGTSTYGLLTPIGTSTWNGNGTSNNWSTAANWVGSSFNANSPLVFGGSARLTPNNDSAAGFQYNGMTFSAGAGAFVIGGNAISLGGDLVNNSTTIQTVNVDLALLQNTNINAASGDLALGGKISGAFAVTKTGTHGLTLSGTNNYSGGTNVSAGTLTIATSTALPANTSAAVTGSGVMTFSPGIGVQTLSSLSLTGGGKIDVGNNALIIHNGDVTNIPLQLKSGFNAASGYWNGPSGIVSSAAAGDSTFLTTLGYRSGGVLIDGVGTVSTDVLVKYTFYGDADLDGAVDGADYQQIDNGFGNGLTGWINGDFNYDGVVNGSDFALIDNTFNQITATNAASLSIVASPAGLSAGDAVSAVPEPAALGVLALGIGALTVRGRRGKLRI